MDRRNRQPEDSLSTLLRVVNVHSSVYCLSDFRAPWGFAVDGSAVSKFHLTLEGRGLLELTGGERVNLDPGELIILPFGTAHTVRDRARSAAVPTLDWILAQHPPELGRLRYGGRGRRTRLLCGGFALSEALPARLLAVLPPILKLGCRLGRRKRSRRAVVGTARRSGRYAAGHHRGVLPKSPTCF